ncbi:MAG: ATP-dependent DNA ligase [candidate division WOR-3 bacterium]|nr:MAG: ATP-dependent DNA ligase [candidate division WOR-3 bacterium]
MRFKALVNYSTRLKKTSSRNAKVEMIVDFMRNLNEDEAVIGVTYISGKIVQGKINISWKGLNELYDIRSKPTRTPELTEVNSYLEKANRARGREKVGVLSPLFRRLSKLERKHLIALIVGETQQGAGEGLGKMAVAEFFGLSNEEMERAYLQKPDIAELFYLLLKRGKRVIDDLGIRILSPVKPMLAQIAESLDDVYAEGDEFALEHKLDGIRIQVHRQGGEVKIFSRHLKDITNHFPELVQSARKLPASKFILDGEAIGVDKKGRPVPFQVLARRTTRKKNILKMQQNVPVIPQYFDVLYVSGEDLTGKPYAERVEILRDMVDKKNHLAARLVPIGKKEAKVFYEQSLNRGNEGVVVKLLESEYRPGKRGKYWFKIKKSYTVDCVILAAEWGHGRRRGLLSNLHLGVLDETRTKYLMVGKTFKGLTDKMLQWLTDNLPRYCVHENEWTVYVKPMVVVEVAFNEVQKSPKYESGVALRFARVKAIRSDKSVAEINTMVDLEKISKVSLNSR